MKRKRRGIDKERRTDDKNDKDGDNKGKETMTIKEERWHDDKGGWKCGTMIKKGGKNYEKRGIEQRRGWQKIVTTKKKRREDDKEEW